MSIFASRSTTFKRAAAFAAAAAILSAMAITSTAEAARVHRHPSAPGYGAPRDPAYAPGYNRQCMTDEGQGRFYPCDGNGEAS